MIHLRQLTGRLATPVRQHFIAAGSTYSVSRPRLNTTKIASLLWIQSPQRDISGLSDASALQRPQPSRHRAALFPGTQTRAASQFDDGQQPRRRKAVVVFENRHDDPRLRDARPIVTPEQIWRFYRSPSLWTVVVASFLSGIIFYFANVETVPVSGRKRFNCHSEESVRELSERQFEVLLKDFQHQHVRFLPAWDARARLANRVMDRLKPVSGMNDVEWELFVIDDPGNANAFVLPCGKVFVFSGLFRHARSEDALAAVLGHEIAHNLAGHAAEQMSASVGTNVLFWSLAILSLGGLTLPMMYGGWMGGKVVKALFEMPMSRKQETEADQIGLLMMAEACYDPREAISFWQSMLSHGRGHEPPEWLSTHPSHSSRIEHIHKMLPMALEKREQSDCRGTQGFAEMFKRAMRRGEIITIYPM